MKKALISTSLFLLSNIGFLYSADYYSTPIVTPPKAILYHSGEIRVFNDINASTDSFRIEGGSITKCDYALIDISSGTHYGDGSNLTGVSGSDNLGNHLATQSLNMAGYDVNTPTITHNAHIDLLPYSQSADYLRVTTLGGGSVRLQVKGSHALWLQSTDPNVVQFELMKDDPQEYVYLYYTKTAPAHSAISTADPLRIYTGDDDVAGGVGNDDFDDYLEIETRSDQTTLNWVGQNGRITADSGTIDFDDENISTTGEVTVSTITAEWMTGVKSIISKNNSGLVLQVTGSGNIQLRTRGSDSVGFADSTGADKFLYNEYYDETLTGVDINMQDNDLLNGRLIQVSSMTAATNNEIYFATNTYTVGYSSAPLIYTTTIYWGDGTIQVSSPTAGGGGGGGATEISDLTDVDTTGAMLNYRLIYNGSTWVAAAEDTDFTFSFDSFGDDQANTQLIGSGVWQAIGGITFSATYTNGPPSSMVVVITGNFAGGSGWTSDSLTFVAGAKTSQATLEATNYPDSPADVATFTATADAEPTKNTTVTFMADTRWDVTSAAGTLNDSDINALSNSDLIEDSTQNFGTLNPGSGEYIALAYPDRLGLLGATVFRFQGITAGFTLQDINPHVNSASYSENFNVYKSNLANMGSGTFKTTGALLNDIRWGLTSVSGNLNDSDINSIFNQDLSENEAQSWGTLNPGAGEYLVIAYPDRLGLISLTSFRFKGMTAGFILQDVNPHINSVGYSEDYNVYKSSLTNMGSSTFETNGTVLNDTRWDTTSAGTLTEGDVAALTNSDLIEDKSQNFGTLIPGVGEYIALAYPDRLGTLNATAFRFQGITAGFTLQNLNPRENEVGYSENYNIYKSDLANMGSGTFRTDGSLLNDTRWDVTSGAGPYSDSDINGFANSDTNDDATQNYGTVNPGVGEYIVLAYPDRLNTIAGTAFRFQGITAGFELQDVNPHLNSVGYSEDYNVYRSSITNMGSGTFTTIGTLLNGIRWGITTAAGTLTESDIDSLPNQDLSENETKSWGTLNPGAGDYIAIAYPDRLGTISATAFRHLGVTAGFTLQNINPYENTSGYSEDYNVYKSDLSNMGSGTFQTNGTLLNDIRWGITTVSGNLSDSDINSISNQDLSENKSQNWGSLNPASGDYVVIAYPDRLGTLGSTSIRFLGMTAGFTLQNVNPHINLAGYSEDYNVYKSDLDNMGSGTFKTNGSLLNQTRYGTTTATTLSDSDINALASADTNEDKTQNFGTINPGAGDYIAVAFPDRLGTLGATVFRHLGMTAGFELQNKDPFVNLAGYSENYNVYRSSITNMGSGTFTTLGTLLNQVRYDGATTGTYDQAFIDALAGTDIDDDSTQTASTTGWSVVMSASEYTFISVPSRWNLNTAEFRYVSGGVVLQAGFTEVGTDVPWENPAGYTENHDVFKSVAQDMVDGDIGIGQPAERLRYYWGTTTTASGYTEDVVETISNNTINQTDDSTQTWGTFDPGVDEYLALAISSDAPDLITGTDFETDGGGTAFLFDGLTAGILPKETVSIQSEYGYIQDYDVYPGSAVNCGNGSGSYITSVTSSIVNNLYYGVIAKEGGYTDDDIDGLANQPITDDVTQVWNEVTAGVGEFIVFGFPKRFGEENVDYEFLDGPFPFAMNDAVETLSKINYSGWSEDFYIYYSEQANLGAVVVETAVP